jgi:hypothetical protein
MLDRIQNALYAQAATLPCRSRARPEFGLRRPDVYPEYRLPLIPFVVKLY